MPQLSLVDNVHLILDISNLLIAMLNQLAAESTSNLTIDGPWVRDAARNVADFRGKFLSAANSGDPSGLYYRADDFASMQRYFIDDPFAAADLQQRVVRLVEAIHGAATVITDRIKPRDPTSLEDARQEMLLFRDQ